MAIFNKVGNIYYTHKGIKYFCLHEQTYKIFNVNHTKNNIRSEAHGTYLFEHGIVKQELYRIILEGNIEGKEKTRTAFF